MPVIIRSWLFRKNKGDMALADTAKVIEELPVLLGRYYTNYAKLAVLLQQLYTQASLRMAETEYGLPDAILAGSSRVAQTNRDILEEADEETMKLYGDLVLVKLTKALQRK